MELRNRAESFIELLRSDRVRITSIFGAVGLLMALSLAGILSGVGVFILMMLASDVIGVILSALLASVSLTTFVSCYLWLTA